MGNPKQLYHITSSPTYETVGDLLFDKSSIANNYFNDPDAFLNITGKDGLTNRQRIEATYKYPEEKRYIGAKALQLPLKPGTLLYLEYEKVNELSFITEGIEVVSTDEPAFKAKQLAALEADPGYFQVNKPIHGRKLDGISQSLYPEVTVWIWCRALSSKSTEDTELTGQFFDLTPFIQSCVTNMGKNGGNFQLTLPPLVCELDADRRWTIKRRSIDRFETETGTSLQGEGYAAHSAIFHSEIEDGNATKASDEVLSRNQFLFHNIIGSNDLIFIRFETLDMEKEKRFKNVDKFYINKENLAGNIYDMIGLVDSNSQSVVPETNDVTINITGRDLSKMFIEDGTYFYALELQQGVIKFAGQSESKNNLLNRIFGDGAINFMALYMHQPIELILKFIIQQLSNIKIVPDGLFSSYGGRINYKFNVTEQKSKSNTDHKPIKRIEPANGIWKIVKLVLDQSTSKRLIQDSSFSTANGSILNFIRTACQEPLVEFYMDTYGDMFHLIVRKPPYDQKALISLLEGKVNTEDGTVETPPAVIDIYPEDVLDEKLMFDDTQVYSWYHFYPKGNFFGNDNTYSVNYIGALNFPEYADIYGSKPFVQTHPYIPYVPKNASKKGIALYERQAIEDLKYVVECNQYLPFTRKGKIIVNRDRRIKIGNIIRYKSTGEIFFVDTVQHVHQVTDNGIESYSIVGVIRGMIEQLIYGAFFQTETGAKRFVSYFNVINTELDFSEKEVKTTVTKTRSIESVNPDPVQQTGGGFFSNVGKSLSQSVIFDTINNKGLYLLEKYNSRPESKKVFVNFINEINQLGYNVTITSTNRSYGEQWELKYGEKGNLNNAEPGHSKHEHFAAIDINIVGKTTGKWYRKLTPKADWEATGVPALAKRLGLQWAGGDGSFGNYVDRVHFQITNASSQANDEPPPNKYEEYTETTVTKQVDRDKIFSNFKVNKFTFNFFLKKLQFDAEYRNVTSRNVYKTDQQGTPLDVVVASGKKK